MLGTLMAAAGAITAFGSAFNVTVQTCRTLDLGLGDTKPISKESPMLEGIKSKILPKKEEEDEE